MIAITDLVFQYQDGAFCLHIPALHIASGEKVAIIGPSGAGKTTLLQLLAGVLLPDRGQIQVYGTRLDQLSDAARRKFRMRHIGWVLQECTLLDYLSVLDNILYPYRLNGSLRLTTEVRAHAITLAEQVGLKDKLKRSSVTLSQGEKQRVALCRALMTRPALLLADEATGNLDAANALRSLALLCQYVDEHQATLLAVTHDQALLSGFMRVIDVQRLDDPHAP